MINSVNLSPISANTQKAKTEFKRTPDLAQYKGSDYTNAVRVERGISLERAYEIAANDPDIDYFV